MADVLALHYNDQPGMLFFFFFCYFFPFPLLLPAVAAWQNHHSALKTGNKLEKSE